MNKDEIYHYGVPGMRWGRRKATVAVGQNIKTVKKHTDEKTNHNNKNHQQVNKQNNKKTSKPDVKNQQPVTKQEPQPTNGSSKKGWLLAATAIAVIGTIVITRKLNSSKSTSADVHKKISTGKKTVEKQKDVKVSKLRNLFKRDHNKTSNPFSYDVKKSTKVSKGSVTNPFKYDVKKSTKVSKGSYNPFAYRP